MTTAPADPVKWAAARTLLVTDKLLSVISALDSIGVQPLVLYGPAMGVPPDEEKEAVASRPDLALLVRPRYTRRARRQLLSQDWELLGFFAGGASLIRDGVTLNLHWSLRSGAGVRHRRLRRVLRASATKEAIGYQVPAPWATALLAAARPDGFALTSKHRAALARTALPQFDDASGVWKLANQIGIGDQLRALIEGSDVEIDRPVTFSRLRSRFGAVIRRLRLRVADRPLHPFSTDFHGMRLGLGPLVFHPQPSAEKMVDITVGLLEDVSSPIIVDVGTGSGAVGLALARARADAKVYGTDISSAAVRCARRNRRRLGLPNFEVLGGSLLEPMSDLAGRVDLVTSILPYLPTVAAVEAAELAPRVALDGGSDDGLGMMRTLALQAAKALRPGGRLVFQLAEQQWNAFAHDLEGLGYDKPDRLIRWPGLVVVGTAQWRDGSNLASSV